MIQRFFARLIPFIFLGIMVVLFVLGLVLFSYLLIVGAIVGVILFLITWAKEKLFPSKQMQRYQQQDENRGRTFEHDDHKK